MRFPLTISELSLWLAVTAIILLIASELLFSSARYLSDVAVERKRLRLIALTLGASFLFTVVMRVFQPF